MEKYNEYFISCFDDKKYTNDLTKPFATIIKDYLTQNYKNRYFLYEGFKVKADAILYKESLEHYITKRFLTEPDFKEHELFKNYVEIYLKDEIDLVTDFKMPINNHFLNTIGEEQLKNILPEEQFEKLQLIKENVSIRHDEIIKKIKDNTPLTQKELDFICDYYAFNRDKDNENHKLLIKYIFNELTKQDNELVANQFVSDAILSFIPKYFSTKYKTDLTNTRILNDSQCLCMGCQYASHIAIERKQFFNINFQEPSHIEDYKSIQEYSNSFVIYMQTIFHELSHTYQQMKLYDKEYDEKGFMYIMRQILSRNNKRYYHEHDLYEIEIDADQNGWLRCRDFYNDFIEDEELKKYLTKNCNNNAAKEHFRRIDAWRYEKKKINVVDMSDIEKINESVKKDPSLIKQYPMLKTFYQDNGDINLSFLTKKGLKNTVIGKNYTKYALLHYPDKIKELTEQTKDQSDFSQIVSTLYSAAMNESRRIKNYDFVSKKEYYGKTINVPMDEDILDLLKKQRLNILDNAINILNNPCVINRKTNFFSPAIYIRKLTEKKDDTYEESSIEIKKAK